MKKRARRLERLKILEVSACDVGAGGDHRPESRPRVVLMKRGRVTGFDDAGEMLIDGVPRWRRKKTGGAVDKADSLSRAVEEIQEHREAIKAAGLMGDQMQVDIVKAMSDRVAEVQKVFPNLSEAAVMARIAESRAPEDQQLWRQYKTGIAPSGAVAKEDIDVAKAIKKMAKRCDQLMAADPTIRSTESAVAKVAVSTDSGDQRLWARYRAAGQVAAVAQLPRSSPAPVGKGMESIVFDNLCVAIRASFPGISSTQVRQWAQAVMAGNPPKEMLTVRTHAA
jgi:hypothetical protein